MRRTPRPRIESQPQALGPDAWPHYALLDSGAGRKLERYGAVVLDRPEAQCLWRAADPSVWDGAARFEGQAEDDSGSWREAGGVPAAWTLAWRRVRFQARLTGFRHVGLFPEQAANWAWLDDRLRAGPGGARVLNLFGYTGVASLVAASAGARVAHVDASRKSVAWARENAALSDLSAAPVRWICEDARAWVAREGRRGARYEGVVLDPPKYGRGPAGEVWRLHEDLPALVGGCAGLLSDDADFLLLNAYSERVSGLALAEVLAEALQGREGVIDWGELVLQDAAGRRFGLSFFARWSRR